MNSFFSFLVSSIINVLLYYYVGFYYLIIIRIAHFTLVHLITKYIFNLERLGEIGLIFYVMPDHKKFIMTGFMHLEGYKPNEMKEIILNRGIKNFSMLRKKLTYFFGNYYWKDVSLEEASKSIKIIDKQLNSYKDIQDYGLKEQERIFKEDELLYEFQIIKFGENDTVVLTKFDHTLSDGLGMLGFSIGLSDNYDLSLFPQMPTISLMTMLILHLASPFYALIALLTSIQVQIKHIVSPFKRGNKEKGNKIVELSKYFNFTKVSNAAKKMGLSFNDLLITIISKNTKKMNVLDTKEFSGKEFVVSIPVSLRPMPKTLKEFVINNQVSNQIFKCPLVNDLSEHKKIQSVLNKYLKNPFYNMGNVLQYNIGTFFAPNFLIQYTSEETTKNVDFIISNVPGPKKPIYYAGCKVLNMVSIPTQAIVNNFILICSYDDRFSISIASDESIKANMTDFKKMLEEDIDNLILKID